VRSRIKLRSNSALCGASHKAEFERDLIRARTGEGRERAKARGVKLGRKPKLTLHQKREAIRRRDELGEPVREIVRSYNVSHSTISRLTA
jgi:DNA invertase Pin-like site-specific DNA recombinase